MISFFLTMKSNKNNDFPNKKSLFIYSFFYTHIYSFSRNNKKGILDTHMTHYPHVHTRHDKDKDKKGNDYYYFLHYFHETKTKTKENKRKNQYS